MDPDRSSPLVEYYHKDGSRIWLENKITGIRDNNGRLTGLHGVSRDITDRKKKWKTTRQSEERYRIIFESTATTKRIVAEDTTILLVNANLNS